MISISLKTCLFPSYRPLWTKLSRHHFSSKQSQGIFFLEDRKSCFAQNVFFSQNVFFFSQWISGAYACSDLQTVQTRFLLGLFWAKNKKQRGGGGGKGWLEPPGKFLKLVNKTAIRRKMRFEILSEKHEHPRDFGKNMTHGDSFYWSLQ